MATFSNELFNAFQKFESKISLSIQNHFIKLRNQIDQEYYKITRKKDELLQETYLLENELEKDNSNKILVKNLIDLWAFSDIDDSISLQQFEDDMAIYKKKLESFSKLNFKYEFIPVRIRLEKSTK